MLNCGKTIEKPQGKLLKELAATLTKNQGQIDINNQLTIHRQYSNRKFVLQTLTGTL